MGMQDFTNLTLCRHWHRSVRQAPPLNPRSPQLGDYRLRLVWCSAAPEAFRAGTRLKRQQAGICQPAAELARDGGRRIDDRNRRPGNLADERGEERVMR